MRNPSSVRLLADNDAPSDLSGPVSCAVEPIGTSNPGPWCAIASAALFGLCCAAAAAGAFFALDFACR